MAPRPQPWTDDEPAELPYQRLSRSEAEAWRLRHPQLSPWKVVAVQALVGSVLALAAGLLSGSAVVGWSLLYGAAAVVVPGALMARGVTSRLSRVSAGGAAVSFMLWEVVKIGVSVAMLMLANRVVQPLSWPALIAGLVVCINLYWLALRWQPRPQERATTAV